MLFLVWDQGPHNLGAGPTALGPGDSAGGSLANGWESAETAAKLGKLGLVGAS